MRISDWSSDVCSSDLRDRRQHVGKACALQCQIAKQQRELLRLRIICAAEAERRFDIGQLMAQPVIEAHLVLIERADQEVRSEERRVGKAWVSTVRSRWSP